MVGVAVLAGLAFLLPRDDDDTGRAVPVEDPGVSHVHGLGIDPGDGTLYVATHHGTFRIPDEGQAERVGGSFQDTMGFTVVGPNDFLGSGHPDVAGMNAGQPGLLGLVRSTDAGESWESLSLSGKADFHALASAHGRVYGWDATNQRFMISTDRRTWDERSTLELYGFAVDPDDPDRIVAAAPGGIRYSTDGGRTWSEPEGPELAVIAWDPGGEVWGVDGASTVQRSTDGGRTWKAAGQLPGRPQALLATDGVLWAAADDPDEITGIYRSTDGGRSWDLEYRDDRPSS
jgi:hypothetical protein